MSICVFKWHFCQLRKYNSHEAHRSKFMSAHRFSVSPWKVLEIHVYFQTSCFNVTEHLTSSNWIFDSSWSALCVSLCSEYVQGTEQEQSYISFQCVRLSDCNRFICFKKTCIPTISCVNWVCKQSFLPNENLPTYWIWTQSWGSKLKSLSISFLSSFTQNTPQFLINSVLCSMSSFSIPEWIFVLLHMYLDYTVIERALYETYIFNAQILFLSSALCVGVCIW